MVTGIHHLLLCLANICLGHALLGLLGLVPYSET